MKHLFFFLFAFFIVYQQSQAVDPADLEMPETAPFNLVSMPRKQLNVALQFAANLDNFYRLLSIRTFGFLPIAAKPLLDGSGAAAPYSKDSFLEIHLTDVYTQSEISRSENTFREALAKSECFDQKEIDMHSKTLKNIYLFVLNSFKSEIDEAKALHDIFKKLFKDGYENTRDIRLAKEKGWENAGLKPEFITRARTLYQSSLYKEAKQKCLKVLDLSTLIQYFYGEREVFLDQVQLRTFPQLLDLLQRFSQEDEVNLEEVAQVSIPFHGELYRDAPSLQEDRIGMMKKKFSKKSPLSAFFIRENYELKSPFEPSIINHIFTAEQLRSFREKAKNGFIYKPQTLPPQTESQNRTHQENISTLLTCLAQYQISSENIIYWLSQGSFQIPGDDKDYKYLTTTEENILRLVNDYQALKQNLTKASTLSPDPMVFIKEMLLESQQKLSSFRALMQTQEEQLTLEAEALENKLKEFSKSLANTPFDRKNLSDLEKEYNSMIAESRKFAKHHNQAVKDSENIYPDIIADQEDILKTEPFALKSDPQNQKLLDEKAKIERDFPNFIQRLNITSQRVSETAETTGNALKSWQEECHAALDIKARQAYDELIAEEEKRKAAAERKAAKKAHKVAKAEAKRQAAEAEAEAKRKAAEEARRDAEAEAKHQAEIKKSKRKAEAETRQAALEAEAKRKAETVARRQAAENAQRKAEAKKKEAAEEARLKAKAPRKAVTAKSPSPPKSYSEMAARRLSYEPPRAEPAKNLENQEASM